MQLQFPPFAKQLKVSSVRAGSYVATGTALVVFYALMRGHMWRGSSSLHTGMEAIATLLALIVGAMALMRYYSRKNTVFLLVGAGFLGVALLDGYHAIVTSAAFRAYMPSDLSSLIPWSWIASRQFLSIFLFLSAFSWFCKNHKGLQNLLTERTIYIFAVCYALASFSFFVFVPLPAGYVEGYLFYRPEEFLPALFFSGALAGYLYKGQWRHDAFEHWLVLSLIVSVAGQSVFMPFSGQLFDFEFDIAHLAKKLSYIFVLVGLMVSMFATFKSETKRGKELLSAKERAEIALVELASHRYAIDQHSIVQVMDKYLKITYVNDKFCEIIKCRPEDYIGRTNQNLYSGYHSNSYFEKLWQQVEAGHSWHGEMNVSAHDGSEVWLDTTIVPLKDERDQISNYIAIRTDITQRKNTDLKNQKNLELLRAAFEGFPGGISAFNQNRELIMVNAKFYDVFGVREEYFPLGSRFDDLIRFSCKRGDEGDVDVEEFVRKQTEMVRNTTGYFIEKNIFDGRTLGITGAPLATGGFVNTFVDMTDRKKSEALMVQQADSMSFMNSIAVAAHHMTDPWEIIDFGMKSIGRFTGWEVGVVYMVSENGRELIVPATEISATDSFLHERFTQRLIAAGKGPETGLPGRALKMGSLEWLPDMTVDMNYPRSVAARESGLKGAVALPVKIDNKVAAVLGFMSTQVIEQSAYLFELLAHVAQQIALVMERASTKQKMVAHSDRLEEKIQEATRELQEKAADLEEALATEKALNELQREFVSMVSHQFHTPLAIIDSSAQLLVEGSFEPETITVRVERIRHAVKRMATLMASTLSAATFDAGKVKISMGFCDLAAIIKEICNRQLDMSDGHIITHDLDDLPDDMLGDSVALDHVFTNLLSNAVKYSPQGSTIHLKGWLEGKRACVSVTDEGVGIDEEDIPNMFNRFFRAKTSAGIAGTGIGLNIVKLFVEGHGGEIMVESTKGQGSIFTVSLPISGAETVKTAA